MCVRQGHTNAKYDADSDDDDDDVGGDDDDGNNQILVQVQIETDHIQINSSGREERDWIAAIAKRPKIAAISKTPKCTKWTKLPQEIKMAYSYDHQF